MTRPKISTRLGAEIQQAKEKVTAVVDERADALVAGQRTCMRHGVLRLIVAQKERYREGAVRPAVGPT